MLSVIFVTAMEKPSVNQPLLFPNTQQNNFQFLCDHPLSIRDIKKIQEAPHLEFMRQFTQKFMKRLGFGSRKDIRYYEIRREIIRNFFPELMKKINPHVKESVFFTRLERKGLKQEGISKGRICKQNFIKKDLPDLIWILQTDLLSTWNGCYLEFYKEREKKWSFLCSPEVFRQKMVEIIQECKDKKYDLAIWSKEIFLTFFQMPLRYNFISKFSRIYEDISIIYGIVEVLLSCMKDYWITFALVDLCILNSNGGEDTSPFFMLIKNYTLKNLFIGDKIIPDTQEWSEILKQHNSNMVLKAKKKIARFVKLPVIAKEIKKLKNLSLNLIFYFITLLWNNFEKEIDEHLLTRKSYSGEENFQFRKMQRSIEEEKIAEHNRKILLEIKKLQEITRYLVTKTEKEDSWLLIESNILTFNNMNKILAIDLNKPISDAVFLLTAICNFFFYEKRRIEFPNSVNFQTGVSFLDCLGQFKSL